jgi:hypothetical protein
MLSLGVVTFAIQHLSVVLHALVLLSFAVCARSAKFSAFECPPKIVRSVVVEVPCLGSSATVDIPCLVSVGCPATVGCPTTEGCAATKECPAIMGRPATAGCPTSVRFCSSATCFKCLLLSLEILCCPAWIACWFILLAIFANVLAINMSSCLRSSSSWSSSGCSCNCSSKWIVLTDSTTSWFGPAPRPSYC